jgi:outer membrane lipoprotein-sorting protein
MQRLFFMAILMILLSPEGVICNDPGDKTDNKINTTDEILERIKQASAKIVTLEGDFIQKKQVKLLTNMPDSYGKFYYKSPDCLRWEILEPVTMGFIVNGNKVKKWRGKSSKTRRFNVKREPIIGIISNQVFAWAKGDFETLKSGYNISILNDDPIEVKLDPLSKIEKEHIECIKLSFSETEDYVNRIEIYETRGDSTQIIFTNMMVNTQLQEGIF